jgi:hypothetical protein
MIMDCGGLPPLSQGEACFACSPKQASATKAQASLRTPYFYLIHPPPVRIKSLRKIS